MRDDTDAVSTFVAVILVTVVLVLAATAWMFLLDIRDSTADQAPNSAFDTELEEGRLVLKHASGDTISPGDTDYIGITGNGNITIDWNDDVTNSTARPSDREAVVTDPITAGTEIAVVSDTPSADSLRFVWFAIDGTGYTVLEDIAPPDQSASNPAGTQ